MGETGRVALAAGSTGALAVYVDAREGRDNVYAQRLDHAGAPVGAEVALTTFITFAVVGEVAAVWTGTEWVAAWTQTTAGPHRSVEMQWVASDGSLGRLASVESVDAVGRSVTYDGFRLDHSDRLGLVMAAYRAGSAAHDPTEVFFRALGDGSSIRPPASLSTAGGQGVDLAAGPRGTVGVAYVAVDGDLWFQRIETDGAVSSPRQRMVTSGGSWVRAPRITFDGTRYAVAWRRDIYAAGSYTYELEVAGGPPSFARRAVAPRVGGTSANPGYRQLDLDLRGGVAQLVWQRATAGGYELDGRRFAVGSVGPPTVLEPTTTLISPVAPADQHVGTVWATGTEVVLAWSDTRWGATELYSAGLTYPMCAP